MNTTKRLLGYWKDASARASKLLPNRSIRLSLPRESVVNLVSKDGESADPFSRIVFLGVAGISAALAMLFIVLLISFRAQDGAREASGDSGGSGSSVAAKDLEVRRAEKALAEVERVRLDGARNDFIAQYKQLLEETSGSSSLRQEVKMLNELPSFLALRQHSKEQESQRRKRGEEVDNQKMAEQAAGSNLADESAPGTDASIQSYCAGRWGDQYSMVEYCVNRETEALSALQRLPNDGVKSRCFSRWGSQYSMVKYCYEKESGAARRLGFMDR